MDHTILKRVSTWNRLRYNRVYNQELFLVMMREEYQEFLDAPNDVEKLDALCDMIFVAIGVIWKLDVHEADIALAFDQANNSVLDMVDSWELYPVYTIAMFLDVLEHSNKYPPLQTAMNIIMACTVQKLSMGLNIEAAQEAIEAVCESNETKNVARVAADDKGNFKGDFYVPPTEALTRILESREVFH